MTVHHHPRPHDSGAVVKIDQPTQPTPPLSWPDRMAVAVFVPDGPAPSQLAGIAMQAAGLPATAAGWDALAGHTNEADPPPPTVPSGMKLSAGAVIIERDGRVWLVEPTNHYGGYHRTFPKGTIESGWSLRATAVKEAFEETGLLVQLGAFLTDVPRTTSITRYFIAKRIGGTPADMGWETQAVWLVPPSQLALLASHANDTPIRAAISAL